MTIRVVQDGPDAGSTIPDPAGHPVTVALAADMASFEAGFLAALRATGPRLTPFEPPQMVGSITVTYEGATCVAGAPESPARGAYDVVFHNENEVFLRRRDRPPRPRANARRTAGLGRDAQRSPGGIRRRPT